MHTEPRNTASIDRVYIHTNEGPQGPNAASALAGYLSRISAGYNVIVDDAHTVVAANDSLVVWGEGGDNTHAVSLCLIGYSATTDWTSDYSKAMLARAAQQVAHWCAIYKIPVIRVTPGCPPPLRGVAGHVDDTCASSEGHSDPGSRFPWAAFLKEVQDILTPPVDWHAIQLLVEWEERCATHPLRLGMHGTDVHTLNVLLARHGYKVPAETYSYGVETAHGLAEFKAKVGNPNHDGTVCGGTAAHDLLTK